jgi:hypothetical protein
MKKLLLLVGLLWSAIASAQFTPGQLLTAAELNSQFALYAPLAGATFTGPVIIPTLTVSTTFSMPASTVLPNGVTATTQGFSDNSTSVATDNFTKRSILAASATIPISGVTGGTYNFATIGSGAQIVVLASGGSITGVLTIAAAGSGYQVGDCIVMVGGNADAILRVTSLSGSGIAGASVVYGGTGYTTGSQLTGMTLPPGSRTGAITGTLSSPLTIIIPAGTYLQGGRRIGFQNNTTGAFTTTVFLSNGAGGSTGTGTVLPQGTANSSSTILYTDGQNDVWPEVTPLGIGALTPATAASTYAPIASPTFTGIPAAPTASATTNTTQLATTAMVNSAITGNNLAGSFTTLAASSTITPSQTAGIVGTTTNNNANTGSVGEYITATGSLISLTSGTPTNITSISLTAGDWEISGNNQFTPAGSTPLTTIAAGASTTSATFPGAPNLSLTTTTFATGAAETLIIPSQRMSIISTTTVYLVAQAAFTVSTCTATGIIRARRVR